MDRISNLHGIEIKKVSSFYKTEPVGFACDDWFVNLVVEIKTMLSPAMLFRVLTGVEKKMGKLPRRSKRYSSRIIDIDLLMYGALIIDSNTISIPHPRMHERKFVLEPLCEIAPQTIHPLFNVSCEEVLADLDNNFYVEKIENGVY